MLQPRALRRRHRDPAHITRPKIDLVPPSTRTIRDTDGMVAQPRHHPGLDTIHNLRAILGEPGQNAIKQSLFPGVFAANSSTILTWRVRVICTRPTAIA